MLVSCLKQFEAERLIERSSFAIRIKGDLMRGSKQALFFLAIVSVKDAETLNRAKTNVKPAIGKRSCKYMRNLTSIFTARTLLLLAVKKKKKKEKEAFSRGR